MSKNRVPLAVVAGLLALALLGGAWMGASQPAGAAPPAAPTAVANLVTSNGRQLFEPMNIKAIAADFNTEAMDVSAYSWADVAYLIDQGTTNTTTVTIQFSNDKVTWVSGPAVVSANAADASDITRFPLFGQYMRFNVNVTGSDRITWTISALAR